MNCSVKHMSIENNTKNVEKVLKKLAYSMIHMGNNPSLSPINF